MIGIYFHCYAAGAWRTPTTEFLDAVTSSGLAEHGPLRLGVIGAREQREEAIALCRAVMRIEVIAEANEGWEQVTLNALHARPVGHHILYCHTKGAAIVDEWQDAWRRSMYLSLVNDWELCIPLLEQVETVGCHWLNVQPGMPQRHPFWGGNMWWARKELVERLSAPAMHDRYAAEAWVGSAPGVTHHDLRPGWPSWQSIRPEARVVPPTRVSLSA